MREGGRGGGQESKLLSEVVRSVCVMQIFKDENLTTQKRNSSLFLFIEKEMNLIQFETIREKRSFNFVFGCVFSD